jgi:hypothetical protein
MTNQITADFMQNWVQDLRLSRAYESGKKEERNRILMFIEAHTTECAFSYCEKCVDLTSLIYFITESED